MTKPAAALAAQKQQLIAEGALYRVSVAHARACVSQALRPEALLHEVVQQAAGYAGARVETLLAPNGPRLQALMPVLLAALSFLARRKLVKPALGAVAAAAGLAWYLRSKRR